MPATASVSNPIRRRAALRCLAGGSLLLAGGLAWQTAARAAAEEAVKIPPPALEVPPSGQGLQKAIFAGGCFWGVQGVYQHVKGVQRAVSGYSGGTAPTAAYELVSRGDTGHAESVEITYDPAQVSYGTLLQIFFSVAHDPTQLNRQGPDVGTQYRSAIFATSPDQLKAAKAYIAQLDATKLFGKPIVTQLADKPSFFPAETYHQDYMTENPRNPYIVVNDLPKVDNLKRLFADRYRSEPVLVKGPR
ncbi:peptide-methionine (S)-S-oxide reductase MsrA [Paracidovorax anthurii]|uniref:Peptide methionine sulfoxide reductase MsrA n=1 Tax=Paracidovorax anthurii TaxID=78229 RepID=A0A328Z9S5_9BURK|nr:peptide-methionine (S)-S-oxide reductase MsrA [Paracidovorax anthurii]RAR82629.1 peptide-methionine (S)-S-oxide reductase [Paracidovorax anthurii]